VKKRRIDSESREFDKMDRRRLLQRGALGTGALIANAALGPSSRGAERRSADSARDRRPNFLFIISDQLGLDAISAHGCGDVHTPNIDRLVRRGVSFMESHSTSPVCSPARSSLFTGRTADPFELSEFGAVAGVGGLRDGVLRQVAPALRICDYD